QISVPSVQVLSLDGFGFCEGRSAKVENLSGLAGVLELINDIAGPGHHMEKRIRLPVCVKTGTVTLIVVQYFFVVRCKTSGAFDTHSHVGAKFESSPCQR